MQFSKTIITATLALASAAIAQQPGPMPGPHPGAPGFHRAGMPMRGRGMGLHPREVVTNAPYSATFTSTATEKLQDGTVLTHTNTRVVARDSQGRLREEIILEPRKFAKKDGPAAEKRTEFLIFDPVAQTITHWNDRNKDAYVMPLPGQHDPQGPQGPGPMGGRGRQFGPGTGEGPQSLGEPRGGKNVAVTELGSKMLNGVSVTGKRVTRTIPAGAMGNEKDLVITHETWFSPDLKIVVSETSSDPFRGTHTTTISNLTKAEPAANLFKAPEGYTVQQGGPGRRGPGGPGFGPGPRHHRGPQGEQAPPPPPAGEPI